MLSLHKLVAVLVAALSVSGCAASGGEGKEDEDSFTTEVGVAEGSVDALAMLAMLNDPLVPPATLRASGATTTVAKALVAHRAGADGAEGTSDDDPFDGVSEVDAVKGVGP